MRKLTIRREKSFVGCAAKMKVYISDIESNELEMPLHTIDVDTGEEKDEMISCRKLGEIKNGEEVTFEIGNESAVIFVIADKASRGFCNDCYPIKAGDEDVSLSGKNKFNPIAGNAFRFNGNDSQGVSVNRKKSAGKGVLVIIAAAIIGVLVGYFGMMAVMSGFSSKEKTFKVDDMSITLTEGFDYQFSEKYDAVFSSRDIAIFVSKQSYNDGNIVYPELTNINEEQYAQLVIASNKFNGCNVVSENGLTYFTLADEGTDGGKFLNHYYIYKSDNAFWLVQFVATQNKANKYSDDISKWAGSVQFN